MDGLDDGNKQCVVQRIVPRDWRRNIFDMMHAGQLRGHMGYEKIYPIAAARFFWIGMSKDFKTLLKTCHACAENGPKPKRATMP